MKKKLTTALALGGAALLLTGCGANAYSETPALLSATMPTMPLTTQSAIEQHATIYQREASEATTLPTPATNPSGTVRLPQTLIDDLARQGEAEQMIFWEEFHTNHPGIYHMEFYDEHGVVVTELVMAHASGPGSVTTITDLEQALSLHLVDNLAMPAVLPGDFTFQHAWFPEPFCPLTTPTADYAGLQLFVVYSNGSESLTIEIRYHHEAHGFDIWAGGLEPTTINARPALIGSGDLSIQVTPTARYTIMTSPFADTPGTTLSDSELIAIAESIFTVAPTMPSFS